MNTAIYSPSGGSVGIGFAIPASTVQRVVTALEHGGVVERGYLGVQIQPVTADIAEGLGLKNATGAIVDKTMPGTPAADAGLKAGDVITKVNGQVVKDAGDLTRQIGDMKPGDKIELTYLRDGAEKTVNVTLAQQKPEAAASAETNPTKPTPALGLQLAPAAQVAGAGQRGVAIVGVDPNGEAAQKGLHDRRRHPRRRRQARLHAGGGEVRHRQRAAGGQEGRPDAGSDRQGRPLRRLCVPEGVNATARAEPARPEIAAALEQLMDREVALEDEVAAILDPRDGSRAVRGEGALHPSRRAVCDL